MVSTLSLIQVYCRQQSKKCAQTVTAPPPKETAKLSLPPQFRFFESESNDTCLVLPDPEWQEGFVTYFKSYQEVKISYCAYGWYIQ